MSCRSCWMLYGFSRPSRLERLERAPRRLFDLRRDRSRPRAFSCANCAAYSPARLPKTSRSDSEFPPSRLAPLIPAAHSPAANRPGHARHLRVAVDAHAAHHVVRRRADLHRLLRDVDVGELLELVVHARQLLLDVLRARSGSRFLIHAMSRNTPPCGLPRPSLTSRTMQRATWSRVSSSGGRRAFLSPCV